MTLAKGDARQRALAYDQGVKAHQRGADRSNCPYDDGPLAAAWLAGYDAEQGRAQATPSEGAMDYVRRTR